MNPMDQLRAARPAHLDTPVDEATRAAELSYAMSQARTGRTRTMAKPVWGLAMAGAAAVTAAAVAVAVSGTGGTTPRAPSHVEAIPSFTGTAPVVRLSAKQILLAAADSSLKAPATTGPYWYVDSVIGVANEAGTRTRYLVHSMTSHRLWIAGSPERESWFVDRNLGTKPAKGAEVAWAGDGSPTKWSVETPEPKANDKNAVGRMELDSTPGKPFGNPINFGDKVFDLAGRNVSVAELKALPTTAAALKQRLLQGYAGHGTESGEPQDADSWLYQVTSGLLRDMPVEPAVRAAAYKVLAGLDGVRSLGEVTDALGRTGQGIARSENWSGAGFERQIIIDPRTGILLTDQIVAVRATGGYAWAKPGTPIWWEATTEASWTEKGPVKP
ncbi:MAG: hypothetical protein JWQ95_1086 [Sphaerisporangium sp.]|nr:hypothetical protein [Sphaerisporangium sp.]